MSQMVVDMNLIDDNDLKIFSEAMDLFAAGSLQTFNSIKFSKRIDMCAHRAQRVCDAQTQLVLAKMETCPERSLELKDRAQHIAFELGVKEYTGLEHPENPFEEIALQTAWDYGYSTAATQKKTQQHADIERRIWEQGVDVENQGSQFDLAAVALYNIALHSQKPQVVERANRLAMEMCCYTEANPPTAQRQEEINRFMAMQSQRLANSIDF